MTLILSNEDAEALLTMPDCLTALEQTYREVVAGTTVNGRRSDMVTATSRQDAVYSLKMLGGVVPTLGVGAIRLNSDILTWPAVDGKRRRVKVPAAPGDRWVGLVLLFSTATGEPLAIFPDGVVQRMRVGATSGLAVRYMARPDAKTAVILGTGWQAGAQAMAVAAVRDLQAIRCYSPNPESRARFAAETEARLGIPVHAAETAESAVKGADIVLCATNSLSPVLSKEWLEPGMHVGSIRDREVDPATLLAVDRVAIHTRENLGSDNLVIARGTDYPEDKKEIVADERTRALASAPTLADIITGQAPARASADEITCFLNIHGTGYQFAAVGAALYRSALACGRGHSLPTEWFTEDVHP